jgi:uncharacterized membrane protein (DUF106 family)
MAHTGANKRSSVNSYLPREENDGENVDLDDDKNIDLSKNQSSKKPKSLMKEEKNKQECQCIMSAVMVVLMLIAIALLIPTLVYVEQVKSELVTQQSLIHLLNTTLFQLSNSTIPPAPSV